MKELPFTLEQVFEIDWDGSGETCRVTYFDPAARQMRKKKVSITEMEALRPEFKRFLVCADICAQYAPDRCRATALLIL